jgi:hypothetical protein
MENFPLDKLVEEKVYGHVETDTYNLTSKLQIKPKTN